jgi:hypothetical protein
MQRLELRPNQLSHSSVSALPESPPAGTSLAASVSVYPSSDASFLAFFFPASFKAFFTALPAFLLAF